MGITYPKSTPIVLARQQIISCVNQYLDPEFAQVAQGLGCGGGNSDDAFAFMAKYSFQTVRVYIELSMCVLSIPSICCYVGTDY